MNLPVYSGDTSPRKVIFVGWDNESRRRGDVSDRVDANRGAAFQREPDGGVQVASLLRIDARELILVTLAKTRQRMESRCWFVTLRQGRGGRLLAGGVLDQSSERLLAARSDAQAIALDVAPAPLCERLADGLAYTRAAGMTVAAGLLEALAIVLPGSAARGDLDAIPVLPAGTHDRLSVPALDDGTRLFALMDELLDEFERSTPEDTASAAWRTGDLVGGAMIEFKGRFADGHVGRWTSADLREFMLVWLPNSLETDADVIADIPDCVCAFLRFLSQRGSLWGDDLAGLEAAVHAAADQLPERFAHAQRTGLAADVARYRRATGGEQ